MSTAEKLSEAPVSGDESDPLLGKVLNQKFKVLSLIATGGMGTIYRGEQLTLGRQVAIKVLTPSQTSYQLDPNFQKRFFLEASILSKLQHPNIVTVFDYGHIEGAETNRYFMAMEYLAGETLFRRLRTRGRLPPPEAINIARQIARGLREAHKHGVVHRDLKPSNIMLVPDEDGGEMVKILDFGLVKVLADDSEELTQQDSFLGSPRYMSPEQISHGKVDLRTDVYSLGVIVYQMLCGKVPFESEKSVQILIAHLQQPVPAMRQRNPEAEVPEPLEAFVMKCLSKDPESRPASMDAFIRQLTECATTIGLATHFGPTGLFTIDSHPAALFPTPGASNTPPTTRPAAPPVRHANGVSAVTGAGSREQAFGEGGVPETAGPSSSGSLRRQAFGASASEAAASHKNDGVAEASVADPSALGVQAGGRRSLGTILLAVAAVAAIVFALARSRPSEPAPAAPLAPSSAAPAEPAGPKSFVLVIESSPSGAEVLDGKEGSDVLGATPLRISIDNDAVREHPRLFTVRLDGYQSYSIVQGPADQQVTLSATLAKDASKDPPAADASGSAAGPPRPGTIGSRRPFRPAASQTAARPGPQPLDIQTER